MKKKTFKNTLAVALLSCAALGASVAHAASQNYTINLTATVPAHTFQVDPADSGWITQTQTMEFDATSRTLKPFEKQFNYKSTAGAIQANLTGSLTMGRAMISGSNGIVIPLTVKFNNTDLTKTTTTVVTAAAAKTGGTATLHIAPASSGELTEGTYTGSVAMIFEPVVD